MSNLEPTLNLPEDLTERRSILESELRKTVVAILSTTMVEKLRELLAEFGITNATSVSWEFHPESDDQGGTDWHISYISIVDKDGEVIESDEVVVNKKSRYSDSFYEHHLNDELYDFMYDYRDDLYENDIYDISL